MVHETVVLVVARRHCDDASFGAQRSTEMSSDRKLLLCMTEHLGVDVVFPFARLPVGWPTAAGLRDASEVQAAVGCGLSDVRYPHGHQNTLVCTAKNKVKELCLSKRAETLT